MAENGTNRQKVQIYQALFSDENVLLYESTSNIIIQKPLLSNEFQNDLIEISKLTDADPESEILVSEGGENDFFEYLMILSRAIST